MEYVIKNTIRKKLLDLDLALLHFPTYEYVQEKWFNTKKTYRQKNSFWYESEIYKNMFIVRQNSKHICKFLHQKLRCQCTCKGFVLCQCLKFLVTTLHHAYSVFSLTWLWLLLFAWHQKRVNRFVCMDNSVSSL